MTAINQLLLTFLLNACWQVLLIAGIAVICDKLLRTAPPHYRHTLWVAALFLAFCLPAVTCGWLLRDSLFGPSATQAMIERQNIEFQTLASVTNETVATVSAPFIFSLGTSVAMMVIFCYLLLVLYRGVRLFIAWRRTRAIAASGYEASLPEPIRAAVEKCYGSIGIDNVSILFSAMAPGPVTIGNSRPLIILPEELLGETDENILISAIGHELVHISRRDYIFNLIYEFLILPLSFHPAIAVVKRRINETRELCCDANVAGRLLQAEDYARSLVKLAGSAANMGRPALTTTVGMGDADNLEVRVMSLLKNSLTGPKRRNYLLLAGLLIVTISGITIGGFGFKVGISEVNAQQIEKPDNIGYAVVKDDEEMRKLKLLIEMRQNELSQATDEDTAHKLRTDIDKLKAELKARIGDAAKMDSEDKEKEIHFIAEYKAQLAAEEPNLTQDQVKEHIEKALIARRALTEQVTLDKPISDSTLELGAVVSDEDLVRMKREAELQYQMRVERPMESLATIQPDNDKEHALRITRKPRPTTGAGCEGQGGKAVVRVAFQSDGTIGEITWVETSTCSSFNASVIAAVKAIEFEPAVKDGQAVSVTKQVEYVWAKY